MYFRYLVLMLTLCMVSFAQAQVFGDVVLTEVMYDDTAGTDFEWVELYNRTANPIALDNWVLFDSPVYPPAGEGAMRIPVGTTINPGQFLVFSNVVLPGIPGAILCVNVVGTGLGLGNTGDNIALYTAQTGGTFIDGSLTVFYPDSSAGNAGNSIEKCNVNSTWSGVGSDWHQSTNIFSATGRFRRCTPGAGNTPCVDNTPPAMTAVFVVSASAIDVTFNESVDQTSAENEAAYFINGGIGNPISALRDISNLTVVHLIVNPMANGPYILTADAIADLAGNELANDTIGFNVNITVAPGDVVITEVMYDDTAGTDNEWVEVHNVTAAAINIGGWNVTDAPTWPVSAGERFMVVPAGTMIAPDQYLVLSRVNIPEFGGEVLCADSGGPGLGNTGDNVVLLTGGGQLVDGSFTVFYPDLAPGNVGNSIEKCDPNSPWSGNAADWTSSLVFFANSGRYRYCTPGFAGFCCNSGGAASVTVSTYGPPVWHYEVNHIAGCVRQVVFSNFCAGTVGSVIGSAATTGWTVMAGGDGNDGDSIIFNGGTPLTSGSLGLFQLQHPSCADLVDWQAGDSSGQIDGPLPVELTSFTAIAGNHTVRLNWETASETNNDRFEIERNGTLTARIDAQENATNGAHYTWVDSDLLNGETYVYSLYSVAINGNRELLSTVNATPGENNPSVFNYSLAQNFPNPFNPTTTINFELSESGSVMLTVYNLSGQQVATLINGNLEAGAHTVEFDAANLTSGLYFYRLEADNFVAQMKMLLLK